jgi:hypothetical protein
MTPQEQDEFTRRRKQRNLVLGLVLGAFVVLFYVITIAKISAQ